MTSFHFILFLISLSILSLIAFILLQILDLANILAKQKLTFLKINLLMIITAPVIFLLSRFFFLQELVIKFPVQFINEKSSTISPITTVDHSMSWTSYILLFYSVGFSFMIWKIILSYFEAHKQLLLSHPINIHGQTVFLNDRIQTPLSFGLPKAKIFFPSKLFPKWTLRETQISFIHEKIHVEQNDSIWKLLSLIVQSLLFFAPWIYYLHKRFILEIEIVCDAKTCQEMGVSTKEYGNVLLAMACTTQSSNFNFINLTDSTLKRRFKAMKQKSRNSRFFMAIVHASLLLAGSTVIAMASGISANQNIFKVKSKLFIDGKLVSSPIIIAKENQKAVIKIANNKKANGQYLRMELIAKNSTFGFKDAIEINYDIQYKNGKDELHCKPKMIILPNKENQIRIASDPTHTYEINVSAVRKNS